MTRRTNILVPAIATLLCITSVCGGLGSPTREHLRINAQGTFTDLGIWLYRLKGGKYSFGNANIGSNETLIMPSPKPPPGGEMWAVVIKRHSSDSLGYPLHIALVEKLFAKLRKTQIDAVNNGEMWNYKYVDVEAKESMIQGQEASPFSFSGPLPANGPIPGNFKNAYVFAKDALASIENLPAPQKDLSHYAVLFVKVNEIIWVEFGPLFGTHEAPHLGCQTELGRDMVFGYDGQQPRQEPKVGKFLQCF